MDYSGLIATMVWNIHDVFALLKGACTVCTFNVMGRELVHDAWILMAFHDRHAI